MSDYTHVLVAVDFSESAEQILTKAQSIATRNNAKLSLLHVVEYLPPIDTVYEPVITNSWIVDETKILNQAKIALEDLTRQLNITTADSHTVLGIPKYEIPQFVREQQCDLVVLGSHGRHGFNIILGSTANAVLNEMPCDILAININK